MPRPRLATIGLAGVLVAFVAIGSLHAMEQPPFAPPDETAHVGYAHSVADLRLPEIADSPPVPASAVQWIAERDSARAERYLGVWVANHPPLHYALVTPLVWLAELTDQADGGLLWMRLANVGFAAVGVALTYVLASELTGGVRRIALASAAVVAATAQAHAVFSQAMNDGLAFAVGTAVVWAGVRCVRRRGLARPDLVLLGATAAFAAGTRAATMLLAAAVVGVVAVDAAWTTAGSTGDRVRAAARVAVVGGVPAAVLVGWFYLRNIALYGDVGASEYLLERFLRTRRGSVLSVLPNADLWLTLYDRLMAPTTLSARRPPFMPLVALVAYTGLVVAFVTRRTGDRGDGAAAGGKGEGTVSRRALVLAAVAVVTIMLTVAQHYSGGGNAYARYLFPVLGVLATLVVIGIDRLIPRWGPLALIAGMAWWTIAWIPVGVDPTRVRRPRDDGPAPLLLQVLPGSDGWRLFAAAWAVAGCVVAAVALIAGATDGPLHDDSVR